jgi:hypothetical protein
MKSRTLQIKTDFLFVVFCASNVSTLLDANKCRHFGAYLNHPRPSLFLTHPQPLSFSKERGDADNSSSYCSPSLTLLERGNKRG